MSAFLATIPAIMASALAMAFPMPLGQSVDPGSLTNPEGEIVDIDKDRARRMTVPVSIEGKGPFTFVIDTGAERTVISRQIADRLALAGEEPARLMSIAGTSIVDMVYVPRLTLGRKNYDGLVSPVLAASHIGADGILGLDGLQDQRILFDFAGNNITIENADDPRVQQRTGEIVVVAKRRSGQLIFTEATIAGIDVNVIVDTGAQISIGNMALRKRLQRRARELQDDDLLIAVTGETLGIELGMVRNFRIGRVRLDRLAIAFADSPPFELFDLTNKPTLLMGMDVLRKFDKVAIDFPRRKIHFLTPKNTKRFVDQPVYPVIQF